MVAATIMQWCMLSIGRQSISPPTSVTMTRKAVMQAPATNSLADYQGPLWGQNLIDPPNPSESRGNFDAGASGSYVVATVILDLRLVG